MKSIKSKKSVNSSFLSNHDLLQNFRNKSFKQITRQTSVNIIDAKSQPKKVSLIPKKSYENILQQTSQNKENISLLSNIKKGSTNKNITYREGSNDQSQNELYKIIKQLNFVYDEISSDEIEIKMILNKNIRKIKELFKKNSSNKGPKQNSQALSYEMQQKINFMQNKIQDQAKKLFKSKNQNTDLQQKLQFSQQNSIYLQQKFKRYQLKAQQQNSIIKCQNRSIGKYDQMTKRIQKPNNLNLTQNNNNNILEQKANQNQNQIEILKKIIQSQQQLINKQAEDFKSQNEDLYMIMQNQALEIEELITNAQKTSIDASNKQSLRQHFQQQHQKQKSISYLSQYNSPKFQTNTYSAQRHQSVSAKPSNKRKHNQLSICLY